jgi:phosphatidylglycerol:prolipoprotein diacylglycerol transferase
MITVSFPGIGIENFTLNSTAFTIPIFGGIEVMWYGIVITLGIVLAFTYASLRAKQAGIIFDDMLDMTIFTVIFGIIGARLYYVLTSLDKYDSFYDMIAIWEGGLAIYGALIAGGITVFVMCKIKKISFFKIADATAPGVMIAQALGRWGNFFNGEAYGTVVAEGSPLYFIRMGLSPHDIDGVYGMAYVHPTFLYESLWNILGFVLINLIYKKKKFDGQIFYIYIAWYGFGRMFIEGLRTDSLYVGVFRISQVVGFVCFVVGAIMLTLGLIKARRASLTARDYAPTYPKFVTTASMNAGAEEAVSDEVEAELESEETAVEQENAEESTPEYTDISDKISKIFDNNEGASENGKDN